MPREKLSFLDLFAKVSGHPEVVERQFGLVMLDMMFAGRETKTYIPFTEVAKVLGQYLPDSASEIESLLKQEVAKVEDPLLAFHNQIQSAIEIKESSTEDKMYLANEDAFLYFDGSEVILNEEQELTLKAIAYSIRKFLNREGEGVLKELFSAPLEKLNCSILILIDKIELTRNTKIKL